jgi:hypothetical protein
VLELQNVLAIKWSSALIGSSAVLVLVALRVPQKVVPQKVLLAGGTPALTLDIFLYILLPLDFPLHTIKARQGCTYNNVRWLLVSCLFCVFFIKKVVCFVQRLGAN